MKYIVLAILCLFSYQTSAYPDNTNDYSYSSLLSQPEGTWKLLEELVISYPKKQVETFFGKQGATCLAAGGIGILSYAAAKHITEPRPYSKLVGFAAGTFSALFAYHGIKNYLLEREEHRQLERIMNQWDKIQKLLPQEVTGALDKLHSTWQHDQQHYDEQAETILSFLKAEIYGRYPYKYRHEPKDFFTSRNLQVRLTLDVHKTAQSLFSLIRYLASSLD